MIVPHSFIYRNSLQAIGDFHSQCYVDCLATGTISAVYFVASGVTDFADDWFFGLKVNGANVLLGPDRPHITATNLAPSTTGLAIPVNFLDRFSPTIDSRTTGTINGPITIIIDVDDGIATGDIGDAIHGAPLKATPANGDEIGFWDSVTGLLAKATFTNLWANYFKPKADALYATLASVAGLVIDAPYDASTWDGDTTHAASRNALRDKIESLGSGSSIVDDSPYNASTWGADATHAPSRNATSDELENIRGAITGGTLPDGDYGDIVVSGSATVFAIKSPITGKAITARVSSIASSATPTPNADAQDEFIVTALAEAATIGAPTGTPSEGQPMIIRIYSAAAQTLAFNAIYRAIGVTLPAITGAGKTLYLGMIYNASDTKWDVLGVNQQA